MKKRFFTVALTVLIAASGARAGVVLFFHGNTMNFYVGPSRFLPPALTRLGLACLAFNRRGHDILSTRNSRSPEGGAFQFTREIIEHDLLFFFEMMRAFFRNLFGEIERRLNVNE